MDTKSPDFQFSVFKEMANLPTFAAKGLLQNPEQLRALESLYIEAAQQKLASLAPMEPTKRAEFDAEMERLSARMELINELIGYHNVALQNLNMQAPEQNQTVYDRASSLAKRPF